MPSNTRKRGAQPDDDTPGPAKKTRTVKSKASAKPKGSSGAIKSDLADSANQAQPGDRPATTTTKGEASNDPPTDAKESSAFIATTKEVVAIRSVEAAVVEEETPSTANPKPKSKKRGKAETVIIKEEEALIEVEATHPKKSRKRKSTKQEDAAATEEQQVDGGDATPKKPKRKRKTKAEREAEAMPLAARTANVRMFFGAHVSAAKGKCSSRQTVYIVEIENLISLDFVLFRCAERSYELCAYRVNPAFSFPFPPRLTTPAFYCLLLLVFCPPSLIIHTSPTTCAPSLTPQTAATHSPSSSSRSENGRTHHCRMNTATASEQTASSTNTTLRSTSSPTDPTSSTSPRKTQAGRNRHTIASSKTYIAAKRSASSCTISSKRWGPHRSHRLDI